MKYNTRRRKSAAVKRGKRKNLKTRRKTRRGGTRDISTVALNLNPDFSEGFNCMNAAISRNTQIVDTPEKEKIRNCRYSYPGWRDNWINIYDDLFDVPYIRTVDDNDDAVAMKLVRKYMSDTWPVHYAKCNPEFNKRADAQDDVADSVRLDQHDRKMNAAAEAYSQDQADNYVKLFEKWNRERKDKKALSAKDRDDLRHPLSAKSTEHWRAQHGVLPGRMMTKKNSQK